MKPRRTAQPDIGAHAVDKPRTRSAQLSAWFPYVAPMVLFVVISTAEGWLPARWYPGVYTAKVALVTALAVFNRATWRDLQPGWPGVIPAVGIGLLACALWIGLDRWPGYPHLGSR